MNYTITHQTTYEYDAPVTVCHNYAMLAPRSGSRALCHSHRLVVRPTPSVSARRTDYFGNALQVFSIEQNHRKLVVTAKSKVTVSMQVLPTAAETEPWEDVVAWMADRKPGWFDASPFTFASPRIPEYPDFGAFARESFTPRRPVVEALLDLTGRIHRDFAYDNDATSVDTPVTEAFRIRRGVCQDFAHVQIGCLRSLGIPARYVSGYLRTLPPPGKPRLSGADESHAWVAAWGGPSVGWVELDPTNGAACTSDQIPVAWGRDYGDVVPMKGIILGGGGNRLTVAVDVAPESAPSD